ncbi:MAG TPA: transporter substrate-binding domain-containing protein [Burkholderiaceae bacterium]|nr:transporter substrate-binding domain-containing protein [Burkholderiaceae bacterium]
MRTLRLFVLAASLASGTAAADGAVRPLRLCADPANLPFSSAAADASARGMPGLYVEIGHAVADALERPFETVWSHTYFEKRNLRTTLLADKCDFAVGLPADAGFMGSRVIFSKPILQVGYALVVAKASRVTRLDDLRGKRVAVQFGSTPQNVLAARDDITAVTTLDPEEAMRRLAAGDVDAAFIWGPSAAYINRTALGDAFRVLPVDGPQMQWPAAIGFSSKQGALRDAVDGVLERLAPRIQALAAKYALNDTPVPVLSDAVPAGTPAAAPVVARAAAAVVAAADATAQPADPAALTGTAAEGREIFNGTCAHCHGPDAVQAERRINLRLLKRRYGDDMAETFHTTVTKGRPAKGMPAWQGVFSEADFAKILAFLSTVQEP